MTARPLRRAALLLPLALTLPAPTVAGADPGALWPFAGGSGAGSATELGLVPSGLALAAGKVLVADEQSGTVRALPAAGGAFTPVAGVGAKGLAADGTVATVAPLGASVSGLGPQQLATAPNGDLLIAVPGENRVRRVRAADGSIGTVAGTGTFSSVAPGDGGPATDAGLGAPYGVVADASGDVLIADTSANRVRRVDAQTGRIETLAGGGGALGDRGPADQARLSGPRQLALAPGGALLIADRGQHRIRRIDPGSDGVLDPSDTIDTVAGDGTAGPGGDGGPATAAQLSSPSGVSVGADGTVVVTDTGNHRVRAIDRAGEIRTLAGTGAAGFNGDGQPGPATQLSSPSAVQADAGRVLVADAGNRRVRSIPLGDGAVTTVAGNGSTGFSGDGAPASASQLQSPFGVAAGRDGSALIADTGNLRVRRVAADGTIDTVAGSGQPCPGPTAACGDGGPATEAQLVRPWDVAETPDGAVYWVENNATTFRVRRRHPSSGLVTTIAGGEPGFAGDGGVALEARFNELQGLAATPDGSALYLADAGNHRVRRIDLTGAEPTIATVAGTGVAGASGDGGPATAARLSGPLDVAVEPGGDVLVADTGNRRIRRIDRDSGDIDTIAGPEESGGHDHAHADGPAGVRGALEAPFANPRGVAVASDGSIAVADVADAHAIHLLDPRAGLTRPVAGVFGEAGYDGDQGPGTGLRLRQPGSVAFAPNGDLLIADTQNNRVRRLERPGSPLRIDRMRPRALFTGTGPVDVTIEGTWFWGHVDVDLGPGIEVRDVEIDDHDRLVATVDVARDAATGARAVVVRTEDGQRATCEACVSVAAPSAGDPPGAAGPPPDAGRPATAGPALRRARLLRPPRTLRALRKRGVRIQVSGERIARVEAELVAGGAALRALRLAPRAGSLILARARSSKPILRLRPGAALRAARPAKRRVVLRLRVTAVGPDGLRSLRTLRLPIGGAR